MHLRLHDRHALAKPWVYNVSYSSTVIKQEVDYVQAQRIST